LVADMPEVIFAPSDGERLAVQAPDGGSLADLCDDEGAPVSFSCRSATCGTCRVEILEGDALLLPAEADERDLLATFATASLANIRLACQAVMRGGPGRLVVCPLPLTGYAEATRAERAVTRG
jgi:ferredoxin